jgi:phage shock protein PspC (stress-responsive transcriptional regulator)
MTTETQTQTQKRLYRSRKDRKIAGVLGGVAEYLGIDPSLVRIAYGIVTVLTMVVPMVLLYIFMMFVVPLEPKARPAG